ncbi:hypothetical protein WMF31_03365 [Sorangium sp. So ce1036]|uniref:serine/threonine protein kinase n=1 Tax=Sorangium sp. So ce1036 TaxID=3133328 RepID=UPI003F0B5AD2
MVILGQEFAGYTIVASLDSPAPVGAYRALDASGHEVTLYVQEDALLDADVFRAELERLLSLPPAVRGIEPVIAGGTEGGAGWAAARTGEDPSVEALLPRLRPVAYELVADVARTLGAAHALGLAHGDLGPHTVVITEGGAAVLRAFGLHRLFGPPADAMAEAARYRAPELFGGWPIDRRTDVYGLGMLLYCVLAGRPPFEGRDDLEACALREVPAPIRGVPAGVNEALARALAKDPDARFQTIQELVVAVRPLLAAPEPPVAEEEAPRPPVPGPDTERSAPGPASRDTLPTGTLPPQAVRRPTVRIADPRRRRRLVLAAGALLSFALLAVALTRVGVAVPLRARVTPPSAPPAPPAGSPVPARDDAAREAALAVPAQGEAALAVPARCDPGAPAAVRPAVAPVESPRIPRRHAPASLTPPPRHAPPAGVAAERHRPGWYGVATY